MCPTEGHGTGELHFASLSCLAELSPCTPMVIQEPLGVTKDWTEAGVATPFLAGMGVALPD